MTDLKKNYSGLQKKHSLPDLDSLEKNFGLFDLEAGKYPLVEIRKKISDKIDFFSGVLSNLFDGEAMLSNIYEAKALDESKKAELFRIFKRLMKYSRQSNILSLSYDEKSEAEFIKEFSGEWKTLSEGLKKYLTLLKNSWEEDSEINHEILDYLG